MEEELERKIIKTASIGKANSMTPNEKTISFLNNYFIFKKIRDTNAKEITNNLLTISEEQEKLDEKILKKQIVIYNLLKRKELLKNIEKINTSKII